MQLFLLFKLILILSLSIIGLHAITQEGYILHFLRKPYELTNNKLLKLVLKPIIGCNVCMSSVYSFILFYILGYDIIDNIKYIILVSLSVAGVIKLFNNWIN